MSDLSEVIARGRPALWVHGHVHDAFDYGVGATRVLANPKGYGPKRIGGSPENAAFDPALIVEVPVRLGGGSGAGSVAPVPIGSPQTLAIVRWVLLRLRVGGDRHVLGYRIENGRGRTSSPIFSFDRPTRTATTASGNRYVLFGAASDAGLDDPLVLHWLAMHDLVRRDVEVVGEGDL